MFRWHSRRVLPAVDAAIHAILDGKVPPASLSGDQGHYKVGEISSAPESAACAKITFRDRLMFAVLAKPMTFAALLLFSAAHSGAPQSRIEDRTTKSRSKELKKR